MVHIYGSSYETCPVRGQKCSHGGDTSAAPTNLLFSLLSGKSNWTAPSMDTSEMQEIWLRQNRAPLVARCYSHPRPGTMGAERRSVA